MITVAHAARMYARLPRHNLVVPAADLFAACFCSLVHYHLLHELLMVLTNEIMTTVSGLNMNVSEPAAVSSTLTYSIAGCSDHSHRYIAENILVDMPMEQSSRWSGVHEGLNMKQWLLLRLDKLSVVGECLCFECTFRAGVNCGILWGREYYFWKGELCG